MSRLALQLLGHEGLLFTRSVLRHLLKWLVYVFLAELGTAGTLLVLRLFGGQSSLIGNSLVGMHTAIVLLGLLGFLASVLIEALLIGTASIDRLMDRVEHIAKRMIRIRRLWRRWKGAA